MFCSFSGASFKFLALFEDSSLLFKVSDGNLKHTLLLEFPLAPGPLNTNFVLSFIFSCRLWPFAIRLFIRKLWPRLFRYQIIQHGLSGNFFLALLFFSIPYCGHESLPFFTTFFFYYLQFFGILEVHSDLPLFSFNQQLFIVLRLLLLLLLGHYFNALQFLFSLLLILIKFWYLHELFVFQILHVFLQCCIWLFDVTSIVN